MTKNFVKHQIEPQKRTIEDLIDLRNGYDNNMDASINTCLEWKERLIQVMNFCQCSVVVREEIIKRRHC